MNSNAFQYPRTAPTNVGERSDLATLQFHIPFTHPLIHPHNTPRGCRADLDRKIWSYNFFRPSPPLVSSKKERSPPFVSSKKKIYTPRSVRSTASEAFAKDAPRRTVLAGWTPKNKGIARRAS